MKVFGIGLSRTATSSLTQALNVAGLNVIHYPSEQELFSTLNDGATDLPAAVDFRRLDKVFPNSKFVLTVRQESEWVRSLVPYLARKREWDQSLRQIRIRKKAFGTAFPSQAQALAAGRRHHSRVLNYFRHRENLLVLDICGGAPPSLLEYFLDLRIPLKSFSRLNSR